MQFVKHNNKNRTFEHLDYGYAFSVPEQSVIDKFVYFLWDSDQAQKLIFSEGEYQMELLLDQSTSPGKYKCFKFSFNICHEDIVFFGTTEAMTQGRTWKITLSNYESENVLIQKDGH